MVMNLKAMKSRVPPPGPPVAHFKIRYFLGNTPVTLSVPEDTTTIPFPNGPMQYHILTFAGGDPPPLYWEFGGASFPVGGPNDCGSDNLFRSLYTDVVNLGGPLATIPRLNFTFNTRFSELADHTVNYGHNPFAVALGSGMLPSGAAPAKVPAGRQFTVQLKKVSDNSTYGPLMTFECQPTHHAPFFDGGTGYWYVNRVALSSAPSISPGVEINSSAPQIATFPAGTGHPDVPDPTNQQQANIIALPPPSYLWGTMERLHFQITQLSGPTGTGLSARRMEIAGASGQFLTSSNNGSLTQADAPGPSSWLVFDTFAGAPNAPNPFCSFVVLRRYNVVNRTGCTYLVQMQYAGANFGPSITFSAV